MSDLRDETTEDGFHEIQFSKKQLVFLFMSGFAVLIFTFLAGVLVGRGASRPGDEPIASAMTDPATPAVDSTSEAASPTPVPTVTPKQDDLTYHDRLGSNAPVKEDLNKRPAEQKPPEPPTPQEQPSPTAQKPAEPPPAAKAKPTPTPTPTESAAKVPTSGRPGTWVLQIAALKNRAAAAEYVQRLVAKGYPAFLETPAPGIYRVRVGRFKDRSQAEQMARRLEKEEQLSSQITR